VTWIVAGAYSVFALGFGTLLFGSPRPAS